MDRADLAADPRAEHTPLPWEVQRLNHATGDLWLQIGYRDPAEHSRGPIAGIVSKQWIPAAELEYLATPDAEQWANARLIVAAVNAYEPLIAFAKHVGGCETCCTQGICLDGLVLYRATLPARQALADDRSPAAEGE